MSSYRVVPVPDPAGLLAALAETKGVDVVVEKRRRLLLWETVRIHLDEVEGLGSFLELEAVAAPESDLDARAARRSRSCATALGIGDDALREGSYADAVARGAAGRRPTRSCSRSRARPPAAPTRRTRTSPSAPRCAPPTAAASPAPTSRTRPTRRASARRPRRSARWWRAAAGGWSRSSWRRRAREECAPCGGCRQRLREFADQDAPIHLADMERVRRTTSLAELLPLSFGPESLG